MARSHHDEEIIDIQNGHSRTVHFDEQQLPENDMDDCEMSSTPKPTKEQEQENSSRRKSLREHITS